MDGRQGEALRARQHVRGAAAGARRGALAPLGDEQLARALGAWQKHELRLARGFPECVGLAREELEDLYQETVLALLGRRFDNEAHLRHALHMGLRMRALNLHSKENRRAELGRELPVAEDNLRQDSAEQAALMREDRMIVTEFLSELTALEQRVFWLIAEGMKYRAIARALGIDINQARNAARACERKRARFQTLYDTGRLCHYRATTIRALQQGRTTSQELTRRALVHLDGCPACRAEHQTSASRLRTRFQDQAAVLLPLPVLLDRAGWPGRLVAKARTLRTRLTAHSNWSGTGQVRERTIALLAGGGATGKIAAGVATVAVIAGTIDATHTLDHHPHPRPQSVKPAPRAPQPVTPDLLATLHHPAASRVLSQHANARAAPGRALRADTQSRPGRVVRVARSASHARQYEPGGFAYLGVPNEPPATTTKSKTAHRGGGPFSP